MQVKKFYAFFCLIAEICLKESFCPPPKKKVIFYLLAICFQQISVLLFPSIPFLNCIDHQRLYILVMDRIANQQNFIAF